jgi:hypothetical protein
MRFAVKNVSADKIRDDAAEIGKVLEYIQGIAEVKAYNLVGKRSRELNDVINRRKKTLIKMEMRCIPVSNIQSLVAKLSGVAMMITSLYFYLAGSMTLADCATMLVCSFMLFNALEAGGNYSALLRVIDLGVTKASKILALPTMDINGKTYKGIAAIMQQIKDINKVGPVAVRVIGQVTLDGLESTDFKGSYAMGVKSASQVTFEGIGRDATLMCGVGVQNSQDIEIRNLGFMLWGGGVDGDAVTLRRSVAVWVHNNDLFYGLKGPDGDQAKGDGSVDMKDDSKFVTVSYNHFWDSGKSSLCGMKKETGPAHWLNPRHTWKIRSREKHSAQQTS